MKATHRVSTLVCLVCAVGCQKSIEVSLKKESVIITPEDGAQDSDAQERKSSLKRNLEENTQGKGKRSAKKRECKAIKKVHLTHFSSPAPAPEHLVSYSYIDWTQPYPASLPDTGKEQFCHRIKAIRLHREKGDESYGYVTTQEDLKLAITKVTTSCLKNHTPGEWPVDCGVTYSAKPKSK